MNTKLIFIDRLDDVNKSGIKKIQAEDKSGIMRYTNIDGDTVYAVTCDYLLENKLSTWCCGFMFDAVEFYTPNVLERDIAYSTSRVRGLSSISDSKEPVDFEDYVRISQELEITHKGYTLKPNEKSNCKFIEDDVIFMLEGNFSEVDLSAYTIISQPEEISEELND